MASVVYTVVEHDGGFAYKLGDVFSETFRSRDEAHRAAERVAAEQRVTGENEPIRYQDADGHWHDEVARGDDRPSTEVAD